MEYLVPDEKYGSGFGTYGLDYQSLREDFERYKKMSDLEFLTNMPKVLHYTSFVCFFKNLPTSMIHIDTGIMHELIHLLNGEPESLRMIKRIRRDFNKHLALV